MKNVIETAMNKKGQFATVQWARPCKTLKGTTDTITKTTKALNIRIGAGYDNLKDTIEKRQNGELPKENQGLNGLEWVQYPTVLKNPKTEKQYLRLETNGNTKFITTYYRNGKETTKAEIENLLLASEKKSGEMPSVMNIGLDSITEIK